MLIKLGRVGGGDQSIFINLLICGYFFCFCFFGWKNSLIGRKFCYRQEELIEVDKWKPFCMRWKPCWSISVVSLQQQVDPQKFAKMLLKNDVVGFAPLVVCACVIFLLFFLGITCCW